MTTSEALSEVIHQQESSQNQKTNRPKLSMIWITEFDGERWRLVARWVQN